MRDELQMLLSEQHERFLSKSAALPINEIVQRIAHITNDLTQFWFNAEGVPTESVALLENAQLDRIASLAKCLERWTTPEHLEDGELGRRLINAEPQPH